VRGRVERAGGKQEAPLAEGRDAIVARRAEFLAAYQNRAYADRYRRLVAGIAQAEANAVPGSSALAEAVARNLFRLMAIKDEYEVARLYTDGSFRRQLDAQFQDYDRLEFHLAPPILGRLGSDGKPRKSSFGPWMMGGFRLLAAMKRLRGTVLDPFGRSVERRMERRLLAEYEQDLATIAADLTPRSLDAACALASVPALIKGFGHVKEANAAKAAQERRRLLARLASEGAAVLEAAE